MKKQYESEIKDLTQKLQKCEFNLKKKSESI